MTIIASWAGEGLADGTAVTEATGGPGDTLFANASSGAGVIDTTGGLHPPSILVTQQSGQPAQYTWTGLTLPAAGYALRGYLELSAWPSAGAPILQVFAAGVLLWRLDVNAAGLLRIRDASNTVVTTAADPLPVDVDLRPSVVVDAGMLTASVYDGDASTPLLTISGAVGAADGDEVRWGNTQTAPTWPPHWWARLAASDEPVEIGPVPAAPISGTLAASLPPLGGAVQAVVPPVFPNAALDLDVEIRVGTTWERITGDVYTRDPITITRGRGDEQTQANPSTASLTINNTSGRYSPRNPRSPWYGLIGRNTPLRIRTATDTAATPYAYIPGAYDHYLSAPDAAALDLTAGLDVRIDITPDTWRPVSGRVVLASKYGNGSHGSWMLSLTSDGRLEMLWSSDGTASRTATSLPIPVGTGRLAVRAVLTTNNGSGSRIYNFYTGPSVDGPWTTVGTVTAAASGAMNANDAPIEIGTSNGGKVTFAGYRPYHGFLHAFQLRTLAGVVVAALDVTGQDEDATTWTGTGGPWTLHGDVRLLRPARFVGEIPEWPVHWTPSGADVYAPVQGAGILRRLRQGASPIQSPLRRAISASDRILQYWPMEDAGGQFASGKGLAPMQLISGSFGYASDSEVPGSQPLATLGTGRAVGQVPAYPVTGYNAVLAVMHMGSPPDGTRQLMEITTTGTVARWDLWYSVPSTSLGMTAYDRAGNIVINDTVANVPAEGLTQQLEVRLQQADADTVWMTVVGLPLGSDTTKQWTAGADGASYTVGRITSVILGDPLDVGDTAIGHIAITNDQFTFYAAFRDEALGIPGEAAAVRMQRVAGENGVPFRIIGELDDTAAMGPQRTGTLLDILADAAAVDGGILYEPRDELAVAYRTRASLYNQAPAVELSYGEPGLAAPLEPVDDDQATRNDITITRTDGSSAHAVLEAGALSVLDPPNGVGRYEDSATINAATDAQLGDHAGWALHLGTWDEARYPSVAMKLHKAPGLIPAATGLDIGDRLSVADPPVWLPPEDIAVLVQGYTETLEPLRWQIACNATPARPWDVGVVGDARVDTGGSALAAAVPADADELLVATTAGPGWTVDASDLPLDVMAAGERVTVTSIGDAVTDGFDRTESSGWGATPEGYDWTVRGAAADYSTFTGIGQMSIGSRGADRLTRLPFDTPACDVEAQWRTVVAPATGSALFFYVLGCVGPDFSGWYALRIRLLTDNTIGLGIETGPPDFALIGAEQIIPGLSVAANVWHRARLKVQGGQIAAKIWPQGQPEPDWQVTTADTRYSGGGIGLRGFVPNTNTNSLPVLFQWGEVIVRNPQVMQVIRAVNGISKAQAAGADVRLAEPTIIAL